MRTFTVPSKVYNGTKSLKDSILVYTHIRTRAVCPVIVFNLSIIAKFYTDLPKFLKSVRDIRQEGGKGYN